MGQLRAHARRRGTRARTRVNLHTRGNTCTHTYTHVLHTFNALTLIRIILLINIIITGNISD